MTQVAPVTHEAECFLNYAPTDGSDDPIDWDGIDAYWALSSLAFNELDGYTEIEREIDGEPWTIRLTYSKSGIAPAPDHDVAGDRLYEIEINCQGPNEAKCDFNISPRFPGMRHHETGEPINTPFMHLDQESGVSVHCQSSNLWIDRIPQLYARAVFELADHADIGIHHRYFDEPVAGRITALERYVRISRSMNEKLIGTGGVLDRLAMHLSDVKGTKGVYKWDNEKVRGHHHVIRHGSSSAAQLVEHHRLGGQIKSYLPEHPEHFERNDPLFHPKLGVKYVAGRSSCGAVDWGRRHEIVDELDERLLSILSWGDVPTEPGGTIYVADDHFAATAADDPVPIHSNPIPEIEANQEHLILTCLRDMTDADEEIVQELARDGGTHARDLADETGLSISTIYRCLDRLEGVITSDNGHVRFVSQKLRREIREIVESVESHIEDAAERAAEIVNYDVRQQASSAFDRWLAKYNATFDPPESDGESPRVRIDTLLAEAKSIDHPDPADVIAEMVEAWTKDGRDPREIARAIVDVELVGRGRVQTSPSSLRR